MKNLKLLILSALLLQGLNISSQITLQHNFAAPINGNNDNLQGLYLSHSGFKYALWNQDDTLELYNLNFSVYKTIIIPGSYTDLEYISWISEGLFNTDTSHIAYVAQYGFASIDSLKIYDENGNTLLTLDSTEQAYDQLGFGGPAFYTIFPTDSGTYMLFNVYGNSTGNFTNYLVYKLPGSLPCVPGCGGFAASSPVLRNSNSALSLYPNPAISYTNIYYTLPLGTTQGEIVLYDLTGRELKRYTVDARMDHIRLTTSDLKAGTYFYQLIVAGQQTTAAKKMVVI